MSHMGRSRGPWGCGGCGGNMRKHGVARRLLPHPHGVSSEETPCASSALKSSPSSWGARLRSSACCTHGRESDALLRSCCSSRCRCRCSRSCRAQAPGGKSGTIRQREDRTAPRSRRAEAPGPCGEPSPPRSPPPRTPPPAAPPSRIPAGSDLPACAAIALDCIDASVPQCHDCALRRMEPAPLCRSAGGRACGKGPRRLGQASTTDPPPPLPAGGRRRRGEQRIELGLAPGGEAGEAEVEAEAEVGPATHALLRSATLGASRRISAHPGASRRSRTRRAPPSSG